MRSFRPRVTINMHPCRKVRFLTVLILLFLLVVLLKILRSSEGEVSRDQLENLEPNSFKVSMKNHIILTRDEDEIQFDKFVDDLELRKHLQGSMESFYLESDTESLVKLLVDVNNVIERYFSTINDQLAKFKGINKEKKIIPFNWADWVDLSILNKYTQDKGEQAGCDMLDSVHDRDLQKLKEIELLTKEKEWNEAPKANTEEEEQQTQKGKEKKMTKKSQRNGNIPNSNNVDADETVNTLLFNPEIKFKDNKELLTKYSHQGDKLFDKLQRLRIQQENKQENKQSHLSAEGALENWFKWQSKKKLDLFDDVLDSSKWCLSNSQLKKFNVQTKLYPNFNVFAFPGRMTEPKALLAAKSYLYSFAPLPAQVVFMTDNGLYAVDKSLNLVSVTKFMSEFSKDYRSSNDIDVESEARNFAMKYPKDIHNVITSYSYQVPESSFHFDAEATLLNLKRKLKKKGGLGKLEEQYMYSLEYSIDIIQRQIEPKKYFYEAKVLNSEEGDHYDWRFFNGIIANALKKSEVLHNLTNAWLTFSRKNGINTWIAHGSLLAWYWNGLNFPWDVDIDVQMPVADLHHMCKDFNQTLLVIPLQNKRAGRYFIDCGPYITLREKANGKNAIDARFIDAHTGMYVDITALSLSNSKPPLTMYDPDINNGNVESKNWMETNTMLQIYNCRNSHFYKYKDLMPLVKTYMEGTIAYIPKKFKKILESEYKSGTTILRFQDHIFVPKLRIWVREELLFYFLRDRQRWIKYFKTDTAEKRKKYAFWFTDSELEKLNQDQNPFTPARYLFQLNHDQLEEVADLGYDELQDLILSKEILQSYINSRESTAFHLEEMMKLIYGKLTSSMHVNAKVQ